MIKALLIALKEVRTYLQDKVDLAFSLLLPIVTFALMYGAFGGQSSFHGTAYIVNEDQGGKYGSLLLERLKGYDEITVVELEIEEAEKKLAKSDLLLLLIIPADFSEKLLAQQEAELIIKQRGNGGQEGQIIAGFIQAVVQEMNREMTVEKEMQTLFAGQLPPEKIQITVQKYFEKYRTNPLVTIVENAIGSPPDPVRQFLTGIVTMYILFAITINARTFVEERKKGTLERLMTTRLTVGELFLGKFLAGVFRGFVQTVILLLLAWTVFRLFTPISFLTVIFMCLVFAAAASSLSLVIASLARSEDAATWTGVFVTMAMTMLSGTFFEIQPGTLLDTLSKISLNTYANIATRSIMIEGKMLPDVWREVVVLIGVTAVLLMISRAFFTVIPGGKRK